MNLRVVDGRAATDAIGADCVPLAPRERTPNRRFFSPRNIPLLGQRFGDRPVARRNQRKTVGKLEIAELINIKITLCRG